jgi:hypothetical protein
MKKLVTVLVLLLLCSCHDHYENIADWELKTFTIQDTLVNNDKILVFAVGDSPTDEYPRLVVQSRKDHGNYLFDPDSELENDSTIHAYAPAFLITDGEENQPDGLWVHTRFTPSGFLPFHSTNQHYGVDSIPLGWNQKLPTLEGIYYYKNGALVRISTEQSESKFMEKQWDGFYFIPNSGRLFDKIDLKAFY